MNDDASLLIEAKKIRDIFCAEMLRLKVKSEKKNADTSEKAMWVDIRRKEKTFFKGFMNKVKRQPSRNVNRLTDYEIKDDEIDKFFDKLLFAVNQPNDVELGEIIRNDIGKDSKLNSLQADLVSDSFLKEMQDWLKAKGQEKGKEGVFYTCQNGKEFFDSMVDKIDTLMCSGLGSAYSEELKRYEVEFEDEIPELKAFLDGATNKRILNLCAVAETLPTAIRVCNAIHTREKYNSAYSLIFMRLGTLLGQENKKLAIASFKSPENYNLFVIDCDNNKDLQELDKIRRELSRIMKTKKLAGKKLILITQKHLEKCHVVRDEVKFNNLTESTKQKLLERRIVNFQEAAGNLISFKTVLGKQIYADILSGRLTVFGDAIDTSILVKLIRCDHDRDKIDVGNGLVGLGEVEDFYQDRSFNPVFLKEDVLRDQTPTEVFAISGTNKEALETLVGNRTKIRNFNEIHPKHPSKFIILSLDNDQQEEQFRELCKVYSEQKKLNIHWLKIDSKKLIWKRSRGKIDTLMGYRDVDESSYLNNNLHYLTENELADDYEGRSTFIIFDTAGMGKSTVLTSLAKIMRTNEIKKNSELWVVRINLNDSIVRGKLNEELDNRSYGGDDVVPAAAIKFVVEELSNLKTDLEKVILKIMIENRGGVAMLFDGFDEIISSFRSIVIDLLQVLDRCHLKKLIVSTRPHVSNVLQDKLRIFHYTIVPFSKKDQIRLLKMLWMEKLGQKYVKHQIEWLARQRPEQLVKQRAEQLVQQHVKCILELHAEQLAEQLAERSAKQSACQPFERSVEQPVEQPAELSARQLAEQYKEQCNEQLEQFYRPVTEHWNEMQVEQLAQQLNDQSADQATKLAKRLAEQPTEQLAEQIAEQFIEQRIETYAKVVVDEVANLIDDHAHGLVGIALQMRMIAEIFQNSKKHNNSESEGGEIGFETCKDFLDSENDKPARMPKSMNIVDLYKRLVNKQFDIYFEEKQKADSTIQNIPGMLGIIRNVFFKAHEDLALHAVFEAKDLVSLKGAAITERSELTICPYTSGIKLDNEPVGFIVEIIDGEPHFTHRSYAEYFAAHFLIKNMLMIHVHDQETIQFIVRILLEPDYGVIRVFLNGLLLEHFSKHPAGQSTNKPSGNESLKSALATSHDSHHQTILNIAVSQRHTGIIKYVLNQFCQSDLALVLLVWPDLREDVIHGFPQSPPPVSVAAARKGYTDVLKLLAEYDEHFSDQPPIYSGRTLLHEAAGTGHLDTVKWLVENGFSLHARDDGGWTLLHKASFSGHLNVMQWLIEMKVDLEVTDEDGITPLYLAAKKGHLGVVEYLLSIGAEPNVACKNGATPLHAAADKGHLEIVQCLIKYKADCHVKCYYKCIPWSSTPADVAVYMEQWNVVVWFLEEGPFRDKALPGKEMDIPEYPDIFPVDNEEIIFDIKILEHGGIDSSHDQLTVIKALEGHSRNVDTPCRFDDKNNHIFDRFVNEALYDAEWKVYEDDVHLYPEDTCGMTKRLVAAALGFRKSLEELLEKQEPNVESDDDQMLLYWCCVRNDNLDMIKFLVERGADINARDKHGNTALQLCCKDHYLTGTIDVVTILCDGSTEICKGSRNKPHLNGDGSKMDMAEWLVKRRADIKTRDNYGNTLLHSSCMSGNLEMVKWLVKQGADVTALNELKQTFLHVALKFSSNFSFIGYLVGSVKCDVSVVDSNGKTAQRIHIERAERDRIPHSCFHCYICLLIKQYAELTSSPLSRAAVLREEGI